MTFCDGAMDMGTGIAQIWAGDIVGGITNTLNGLSSIFSLFSSWKEKMEEMKREWYIAEIETNRAIRERTAEYAANQSQISDIGPGFAAQFVLIIPKLYLLCRVAPQVPCCRASVQGITPLVKWLWECHSTVSSQMPEMH